MNNEEEKKLYCILQCYRSFIVTCYSKNSSTSNNVTGDIITFVSSDSEFCFVDWPEGQYFNTQYSYLEKEWLSKEINY